ncbi:uncharacterized protein LOC106071470 isoform X2 [Biomphalaria glabrata]|uniref:Uncharacterized protein LOC106071470 isoform X2 n=1 Tax=Biomphalaria glabrata TaxID=6526 RepID=A0A9W2ZBX0_BIOGL|nr:uncharacterized protein LOC106071470 isoform X2 [Biomphalaria glabrata]
MLRPTVNKHVVMWPAQLKQESPKKFDASKFRAANKEQKKDFPTLKDDMTTPRYFQPPDQRLDDIGVKKRDDTYLYKQAPNYDKDELDLMRQLEEELL